MLITIIIGDAANTALINAAPLSCFLSNPGFSFTWYQEIEKYNKEEVTDKKNASRKHLSSQKTSTLEERHINTNTC